MLNIKAQGLYWKVVQYSATTLSTDAGGHFNEAQLDVLHLYSTTALALLVRKLILDMVEA